ncbi:ferrochelatase [Hahella sp. SMD15-11]|uniref:Ferrochelatase n=1 Tax=Thermohahella caldifontis TaxID=3142973 RepID=A0AB39USG3_9GAMM
MTDRSNQDIGILLVNLGTPDAPTPRAIRRYLREFLGDPRVVEIPRPVWWLILNLFVLPFRPKRLVEPYESIWTERGAPIRYITENQARALETLLNSSASEGARFRVLPAMTYGEPALTRQLEALHREGIRRILCLPLYPQYSCSTTAATLDVLYRALMRYRDMPEVRTVRSYADFEPWVEALASHIRRHWEASGRQGHLLFSFHGIPQSYADQGDPYPLHCEQTAHAVAGRLGLRDSDWTLSYQSRFGKAQWLTPYTDETVRRLGAEGCKALDVVCPGFAADCLETLEEIDVENRRYYEEAGGKDFRYIPALNDSPGHVAALAELIRRHCSGWPAQP